MSDQEYEPVDARDRKIDLENREPEDMTATAEESMPDARLRVKSLEWGGMGWCARVRTINCPIASEHESHNHASKEDAIEEGEKLRKALCWRRVGGWKRIGWIGNREIKEMS